MSDDKDALACKVVALINLGRYEEALKLASGNERAYCLYKLKRYEEALAACSSPLLRAQALFKLGRFKEAAQIYEREGANENDELSSNLCAALLGYDADAALTLLGERRGAQSDTYEFAFNGACAAIEKRDWKLAAHLLATAHDTASAVLQEGFSEAEKAAELSLIVVQQGFVAQRAGLNDEAIKRYSQLLEWKGSDKTAVAVASANLAQLQEQHGLFDSLRRLERARLPEVWDGLTEEQREAVGLAHAAVLLRLNRRDEARRLLEEMPKRGGLVRALLAELLPQPEALALLAQAAGDDEGGAGAAAVARARLLARAGDRAGALAALAGGGGGAGPWDAGRLAAVAALARGGAEGGEAALQLALGRVADERSKAGALLELARLKSRRGDLRGAADDYKLALRLLPGHPALLAGYVGVLAQLDPAAADALAASLPGVPAASDGEEAESRLLAGLPAASVAPAAVARKTDNAATTTATATAAASDAPAEEERRRRKRTTKKKKKRLPKDLDKPIDPERWLPLKQRSSYVAPIKKGQRGKKGRIGGAGGHQGVAVSAEVAASLDAAAKSKLPSPPPQVKGNPRRKK